MLVLKDAFEHCLRRSLRPVPALASTRMVLFEWLSPAFGYCAGF